MCANTKRSLAHCGLLLMDYDPCWGSVFDINREKTQKGAPVTGVAPTARRAEYNTALSFIKAFWPHNRHKNARQALLACRRRGKKPLCGVNKAATQQTPPWRTCGGFARCVCMKLVERNRNSVARRVNGVVNIGRSHVCINGRTGTSSGGWFGGI